MQQIQVHCRQSAGSEAYERMKITEPSNWCIKRKRPILLSFLKIKTFPVFAVKQPKSLRQLLIALTSVNRRVKKQ